MVNLYNVVFLYQRIINFLVLGFLYTLIILIISEIKTIFFENLSHLERINLLLTFLWKLYFLNKNNFVKIMALFYIFKISDLLLLIQNL